MMQNKITYVLALFVVFNSYAQNQVYKFTNFSTSQGLSQSSVIAIQQDKLGQMWFGTRDGLNKYDGSEFKVYRNIVNDSLSISNNNVLSIKEDKDGVIWVGTYNGLNKYNPLENNFKRYFREKNKNSLSSNTIWCIEELGNEIWIGTTNGLSIYDKSKDKFINITYRKKEPNSLNKNFITKILKTKNGDIWLGTSKGLFKLIDRTQNKFHFKRYYYKSNHMKKGYDIMIQDLLEDEEGNILAATKGSGMLLLKKDLDSLTPLNKVEKYSKLKSNDYRVLSFDKKGNLWFGTNNGVYIIDTNDEVHYTKGNQNLNKMKSIYCDLNGSMWLGTYYDGVSLWDENNLNFTNLNYNNTIKSLSHNVVSSIVTDNKSNTYIGTEGGGITVLDSLNRKINVINTQNYKGLLSNNIKSLLFLDGGYLFIGTFDNGLTVLNLKSKKIIQNYIPVSLSQKIGKVSVYSIKKEKKNTIWIGTFGKGLIRFNTIDKSFQVFENKSSDIKSLTSNRVRNILVDSKKRVWVGTQKGLSLISFSNNEDYKIKNFFFDEKINSGDDILTMYEDKLHDIWIGTKAQGLFKFNGNSFDRVNIIGGKNKTEIKSIHSILEDNNKSLWLSSNYGIANYNTRSKETIIYNQTDGLIDNEFNDNAANKTSNEVFYFGGPKGISYFNPNKININEYSPQVVLTDFKVKNESVEISKQGILKKHISFTKSISLTYDNANFSINFSIPNFINSNNNHYLYRLIGIQDEWITTTKNEAIYTIQKPGTYVFEVKGANNDGIWNEKPTKLEIKVSPAPWRSWWAFTIYFLLIIVSLIALVRFSKSKSKLKHELELEHIENIRNEDLNKTKLEFFTNISHEFRTPLTLILGPLQQILSDYQGSNKMYKKLLIVENNANHLLRLINRLMNFRKLENNQSKLQSAEGNIVKFLKEIYFSFTEHAKNGGYNYNIETNSEEVFIYYDREKLERVFYNLISNAFRYTPKGGDIKINIRKAQEELIIEVEDNGVGISGEYIDKIFDRFFEVPIHNKPQENYNKGTGIGLSIAKNIVKLHKGNIEAENKLERGVVFRVTLPLGRLHLSDDEVIADFKVSDDISQYKSQLDQFNITIDESLDDILIDENKLTILIVEDNKPLRSFIKNLLKKEYNILEAENGRVAIQKAIEFLPDLIVSDVVMPVMVGTELCAKIKENLKTSHIPVILLTSRSSLIFRLEGLNSGADEYISKPFDLNEFKLKIKNILESNLRLKNKFTKEDYLSPNEITVSSIDEKLLKKAFKIVEENISNNQFDIPFFCSELGVSRTMLFVKIKAWTNVTPNEFIQTIRMKRAAQLLENNKLNISQVCYKVGFKNPKYFSKCFNKKYGLTPSEYQSKFFDDNPS